jgi:hypothetical protein
MVEGCNHAMAVLLPVASLVVVTPMLPDADCGTVKLRDPETPKPSTVFGCAPPMVTAWPMSPMLCARTA